MTNVGKPAWEYQRFSQNSQKILFTVSNLKIGGIQRVTSVIAGSLYNEGLDVTLLNTSFRESKYETLCPVINSALTPVTFVERSFRHLVEKIIPNLLNPFCVSKLYRVLKTNSYDTVILNPEFLFATAHIKKRFPHLRVLLWMHNNFDIYMNKYFVDQQTELCKNVNAADGVICLEEYTLQRWSQYNQNCYLVHNPLTIQPSTQSANLDSKTIAFTGRLEIEQKGLDYLIAVAKGLPEGWKIAVAGSGNDAKEFTELIRVNNLSGKIILKGALFGSDLLRHYLDSSIFILPSRWEGFPLVSVEAMSLGLPVVAFDIPALREVTENGQYGVLAKSGNVQSLVEQISKLTMNREMREKYARLGIARSAFFSVPAITAVWERLLMPLQESRTNEF
jgi:glycosyltransferase involved in cell wall biosynthesis